LTQLTADRFDPNYGQEAELVLVRIEDGALKLLLDDGGVLAFDLDEFAEAFERVKADWRAAA
jgi:hypothetical protein